MLINISEPVAMTHILGEVPKMPTLHNSREALRSKRVLLIFFRKDKNVFRKTSFGFVLMGIESTK
ncbi:MAG: hypothetical protein MRQ09_06905, partial [Candidatus Midichloria sp.]|nr:hypothetical protein [Candidatus Midichloria sp.]